MMAFTLRAGRMRSTLLMSLVALCLCGCVTTTYVDNGLQEIPATDYPRSLAPQLVQLFFQFQNKGIVNAGATDLLRQNVTDTVTRSQLFSSVSATPVGGSSLLSITINNVFDDPPVQGGHTGLTSAWQGTIVSDGYVCTLEYGGAAGESRIVKSRRHTIYTSVGTNRAPAAATKAANPDDAVRLMTRQLVSNALRDLAADSNFKLTHTAAYTAP